MGRAGIGGVTEFGKLGAQRLFLGPSSGLVTEDGSDPCYGAVWPDQEGDRERHRQASAVGVVHEGAATDQASGPRQ